MKRPRINTSPKLVFSSKTPIWLDPKVQVKTCTAGSRANEKFDNLFKS